MHQQLTIDGQDIYTSFGAILLQGSISNVLSWPSTKPIEYNDWAEEDGIDADLSGLCLDSREISLSFSFDIYAQIRAFYAFLKGYKPKTYSFTFLNGLSFNLRLKSMSSLQYALRMSKLTVTLIEDNFSKRNYASFGQVNGTDNVKLVDLGNSFSKYGVTLLKGSYDSAFCPSQIKDAVLVNLKHETGQDCDLNPLDVYDEEEQVWKRSSLDATTPYEHSKSFTLKCLLKQPTMNYAIGSYYKLLYDLIDWNQSLVQLEKCMRTISFSDGRIKLDCYYGSQKVNYITKNGNEVWISFDLTMNVVSGINTLDALLTSESNYIVNKEGDNTTVFTI